MMSKNMNGLPMRKPIKPLSPNSNKTKPLTRKLSLIVVFGRSEESWGRGEGETGGLGEGEDGEDREDREDELLGMGAFSLIKSR